MKRRRTNLFSRLSERRLKLLFAMFFVALAVPAAVLVWQAYDQLKWEAFRNTQITAEELAERIGTELLAATNAEEARSFGDYSFLVAEGNMIANFVQRSPLSTFPVQSELPGVLGYFQVDAEGQLTTPLLPEEGVAAASYGIAAAEEAARSALATELRQILTQNELARPQRQEEAVIVTGTRIRRDEEERGAAERAAPVIPASVAPPEEQPQAAFDRLRGSQIVTAENMRGLGASSVAQTLDFAPPDELAEQDGRFKRVEQSLVPEAELVQELNDDDSVASKLEIRVQLFESEVDPFEFSALDTGHFVLFRNAWRDGQRYVQGALIDRGAFLAAVLEEPFRASTLAEISNLELMFRGESLTRLLANPTRGSSTGDLAGELLHRTRLSPPFGDMELLFNVSRLPRATGTGLLAWVTLALIIVLCGGFMFMYRLATEQMRLARQQQDFVSAVSHELKTPLTSIRMYGELLKSGWADEKKRQTYYDYIHGESERLSRLIDNVLQLARLTRSTQQLDMQRISVAELIDMTRSKIATQIERAGFELRLHNDAPPDTEVEADTDSFAQIVINLVDNALKFAANADKKAIEITCRCESDGSLLFTVRDFGPGVPKEQMKKIFELFYRPADELTRDTAGTGIGLALVRQLADAMHAGIDVRNCDPGAEFRLRFPPARTRPQS